MRLHSIVWWAVVLFWLPNGEKAPYSTIVVKHNEGSCKFAVQSIVKQNNLPYSEIPTCVQSTTSNYKRIVNSGAEFQPDDGRFERIVKPCRRKKCTQEELRNP